MTARYAYYAIICVFFLTAGSFVYLSTLGLPELSPIGLRISALFPLLFGVTAFMDARRNAGNTTVVHSWGDTILWGLFAIFFVITAVLLYIDPIGMANLI